MQMNCGDKAYPFSLPLREMRTFLISSTALFCLETNNCCIYVDWTMVSNASRTSSSRRARQIAVAVHGELISIHTGSKHYSIEVTGMRN